ncbi:MAG: hypothetical protein PHP92_04035 [Candidatus Nanoarchaeia archaeon]|nr:hypothetical protein [Candidatus Nanoarchaeia archaeon]
MILQKLFHACVIFLYRKNMFPVEWININCWLSAHYARFVLRLEKMIKECNINGDSIICQEHNINFYIPFYKIKSLPYFISTIYYELKNHPKDYSAINDVLKKIYNKKHYITKREKVEFDRQGIVISYEF